MTSLSSERRTGTAINSQMIRSAPVSVSIEYPSVPVILSADLAREPSRRALRITTERSSRGVTAHVGGEVDAANETLWRRLLREVSRAATPPGLVLIDTDGLDFMGCCAVTALALEADRCRQRGVDLCIVSRKPIVRRVIAATGLSSRLPVYPDVDRALRHRG
jgi:anti-anti-sigma factor